jgi:hypothetical protein
MYQERKYVTGTSFNAHLHFLVFLHIKAEVSLSRFSCAKTTVRHSPDILLSIGMPEAEHMLHKIAAS